jgi:hypothetical protein
MLSDIVALATEACEAVQDIVNGLDYNGMVILIWMTAIVMGALISFGGFRNKS